MLNVSLEVVDNITHTYIMNNIPQKSFQNICIIRFVRFFQRTILIQHRTILSALVLIYVAIIRIIQIWAFTKFIAFTLRDGLQ